GTFEVRLKDNLPGYLRPQGGAESERLFRVRAKEVIVCVGPWTERFGDHVIDGPNRKLKPSKGVHLILPWEKLPIERCLVMYAGDGRIIFAIPRKDLGQGAEKVIIGTTDSAAAHEDLENLHAHRSDVAYLFKVLQAYFPERKLSPRDVVMTYAGVRPLLDSGEHSEAKTSREHEVWKNSAGVVFMAGGKYTTFRKISQEIADFAFPNSKTDEPESKAVLSEPADYEKRLSGKPVWGRFTEEWIKWKITHHCACTLEDVVFRRVPLWMEGKSLSNDLLEEVALICASEFGWSNDERLFQLGSAKEALGKNLVF
ncbi:MAG: FAD-dependent oxidoreductase, partial [Bdellovibrionota bacterium]